MDLTEFVTEVNRIKRDYPLFQEESLIQRLNDPDPGILMLWKASTIGNGEALLVLNKNPWNPCHFHCYDLYRHVQAPPPLRDVSPEWQLDHLSTPFDFDLGPGMGRVLVAAEPSLSDPSF